MNEWTSYKKHHAKTISFDKTGSTMKNQMSTFHAPLAENKQPSLKSIIAGCTDDVLPTNEELLADDLLALIQNEMRHASIAPKRGLDEKLARGTILWYIETSKEAK